MSYLQNITRQPGGGKLGGILTIDVVRKADVESLPPVVNGTVYGAVVLKAGKSFVRWVAGHQSANINSQARNSREGTSKNNTLPFFLPIDRASVRPMLELAEADEFIVLFTDAGGRKKIFGTLDAPAQFEFSHSSGTAHADKNGNNCSFYYTGPPNIFFYEAALPAPSGAAPAIVRFNGVAIASLTPGQELNILSDYGYNEYFVSS